MTIKQELLTYIGAMNPLYRQIVTAFDMAHHTDVHQLLLDLEAEGAVKCERTSLGHRYTLVAVTGEEGNGNQ